MRRPLILVAASGLAREAVQAVRAGEFYDVIGFVDENPARHGDVISDVKVLGGLDVVSDIPDAAVLLCTGSGAARASLAARLDLDETRWATVVDPRTTVAATCTIGRGSILLAGCVLTTAVTVGRHVVAMPNVVLTHDDVVDDFATLCAGVALGGSVRVGTRAYLGMNAGVREGRHVGADAVVGMGSVVLTDVPANETWAGVPAAHLGSDRR